MARESHWLARMPANEPLRMGVIGLGYFAQVAILPAFRQLEDVELSALVSGNHTKREVLGKRYGVTNVVNYSELAALLERNVVDAMYIALPPDLHAEYAIACMERGVHVLCEKPMAASEAQCRAMIDASEQADVKLMIGYRLHFEIANLTATQVLKERKLGVPRVFSSVFSMQVREGNIRVQPRPGAGPLWDLGIYCINAARYLFRDEPHEVVAMTSSNRDGRFEHVDEQVSAVLRFSSGASATFTASFGAHDRAHCEVVCTEGVLTLENAYEYAEEITLSTQNGGRPRQRTFGKRDQIAAEIEYFARCIRDDLDPEPSGYEGLADVRIIEAIERAARSGNVETIAPVERVRRPTLEQEIYVPAHGKPKLVGVESATK
ncbi:MAG: Gfo/Idh/MocA family protein [Kofleriaceae bacterium]